MNDIASDDHRLAAQRVRQLIGAYQEHEDLISIGAYRRGSNPDVDKAIDLQGEINGFLRQRIDERSTLDTLYEATGPSLPVPTDLFP